MLPRLRTAQLFTGTARSSTVLLLVLLLLAALVPAGALSASHLCRMECCAGKPPHEAGACSVRLPDAIADAALAVTDSADEHATHHEGMVESGMADETIAETSISSEHCQTARPAPAKAQAPQSISTRQQRATVAARAFNTPCAAECAALLSLVLGRRPREAAVHSLAAQPRPPTLIKSAARILGCSFSTVERRRQSRPRAPPSAPVNISA